MAKDKRIKEYFLKNGTRKFMFRIYAGIDPVTGKKVQIKKRNLNSYDEAYATLIRLELDIRENGIPTKNTSELFEDVYSAWFDVYKKTVKESTWSNTKGYFQNHILKDFEGMKITKINVLYCQKIVNKWSEVIPNNYKRFKNLVSNVFDYAISIGQIENNPMSKITVPRISEATEDENEKIVFYTKDELKVFLSLSEKLSTIQEYTFFWLLAYTGLRKGEALALNWTDINFKTKKLKINKTVARGYKSRLLINAPKTKNSKRTISLDDQTLDKLNIWKRIQKKEYFILGINTLNKNQLVFSNTNNDLHDPSHTYKWLKKVYRENKIKKLSAHGFRHTHASLLFESGASLKDVQMRLGHADIQTTANIYTHVTPQKEEQTGADFANFMEL